MNVELIAYTQWVDQEKDKNPLSIIEQAASVCYGSVPTDAYKIAKGCKATSHNSVLEHTSFVFHISGVSRALLAQLSRHRHISLSVASQRYINYKNGFDYVNPFYPGTEAHDAFDAVQQPYTLAIDEDKISKEKFNALLDELDALDVKFTKEKDSDSKLDIQG